MPDSARPPSWARIALAVLAVVAIGRAWLLVRHEPLLALANSYDQIRYSACLDLAPWRPGVPADRANTAAPLSRFAFQALPAGLCVWTSDLAFTAPVALGWRLAESLGARPIHSVRRLADLRLLLWFAVAFWATRVFVRANRIDLALAHLAGFALVAMDPADTLYLATFYAEAAAAFGLYACGVGAVAATVRPTRSAFSICAAGALMLATSKFQHLVLPAVLGAAVLLAAGRTSRRVALVCIVAGAIGCAAHSMAMNNKADYALLVLLKETSDVQGVARALDLDDACLAYIGRSVYAMPGPVEKTCTTVDRWRRSTLWWLLFSDPQALGRALTHIPRSLLPWLPGYLGVAEGEDHGTLPPSAPSLSALLGRGSGVASLMLALPWLVFAGCIFARASASARAFALACAAGATSVVLVALLGDGDVEFAKHAHLAINFALASLCVPIAAAARRALAAEPRA
jgi:hypothetical protein